MLKAAPEMTKHSEEEFMNDNPDQPGGPLTPQPQPTGSRVGEAMDDVASTVRDFVSKVPETINKAIDRALNVRDTTVLLRLSEPSSDALDTLVSAGIFKSRAEAAAFLIDEGIKAQAQLFARIQSKLTEIERLREELRHSVSPELQK
jgi:Arc/MetJ-type ribon-helix-helix transcriptional regulator